MSILSYEKLTRNALVFLPQKNYHRTATCFRCICDQRHCFPYTFYFYPFWKFVINICSFDLGCYRKNNSFIGMDSIILSSR